MVSDSPSDLLNAEEKSLLTLPDTGGVLRTQLFFIADFLGETFLQTFLLFLNIK